MVLAKKITWTYPKKDSNTVLVEEFRNTVQSMSQESSRNNTNVIKELINFINSWGNEYALEQDFKKLQEEVNRLTRRDASHFHTTNSIKNNIERLLNNEKLLSQSIENIYYKVVDEYKKGIENGLSKLEKSLWAKIKRIDDTIQDIDDIVDSSISFHTDKLAHKEHTHEIKDVKALEERLVWLMIWIEEKAEKDHIHEEYATREELVKLSQMNKTVIWQTGQQKIQFYDEWNALWYKWWISEVDFTWDNISASINWSRLTVDVTWSASSYTAWSVLFWWSDGSISEDNSNLFWDDTNNRLGIWKNSGISYPLEVYNETSDILARLESWDNNAWIWMRDSWSTDFIWFGCSSDDIVFRTDRWDISFRASNTGNEITRMTILDTGNVGIWESTPNAKLHVEWVTEQFRLSYDSSNYWSDTIASDGARTIVANWTDCDIHFDLTWATDWDFIINDEDIYVDTSRWYVGVWTNSPEQKFHVENKLDMFNLFRVTWNFANVGFTLENEFDNTDSWRIYRHNAWTFRISRSATQPYSSETNALTFDSSLNLWIWATDPAVKLDVNGESIRIRNAKTPSSSLDTWVEGQIAWDADYIYVCTSTNSWKRVAIASW